ITPHSPACPVQCIVMACFLFSSLLRLLHVQVEMEALPSTCMPLSCCRTAPPSLGHGVTFLPSFEGLLSLALHHSNHRQSPFYKLPCQFRTTRGTDLCKSSGLPEEIWAHLNFLEACWLAHE